MIRKTYRLSICCLSSYYIQINSNNKYARSSVTIGSLTQGSLELITADTCKHKQDDF